MNVWWWIQVCVLSLASHRYKRDSMPHYVMQGVPNVAVGKSTENQHPRSWELQHLILNEGVKQSETDIKAFI